MHQNDKCNDKTSDITILHISNQFLKQTKPYLTLNQKDYQRIKHKKYRPKKNYLDLKIGQRHYFRRKKKYI